MEQLTIWIALSRNNVLLLFDEEPKFNPENDTWEGQLYLNSVIYKMLEPAIKKSNMTHVSQPEQLTFSLPPAETL